MTLSPLSPRAAGSAGAGSIVSEADPAWAQVPQQFRSAGAEPLPSPYEALFGPLRRGMVDGLVVVGQIGQSIDGCIATASGHSHYVNGSAGLAHLHRLRALVDAVVVGVGAAVADNPRLTVRLVDGPQPARVVIDPTARLRQDARIFAPDGVRRLAIVAEGACRDIAGVEVVPLPAADGLLSPAAILAALAERGFRRLLIEGGAMTISRFLQARCLDRLHVIVAPVIVGGGKPGLALPPIERMDEALRPPTRVFDLGGETLFDCDFAGRRAPVWRD